MDPEEVAHYRSVLVSFREYEAYVMREIFRRKTHMNNMPEELRARLSKLGITQDLHLFINAARENQKFLEHIVQVQLNAAPIGDLQIPVIKPRAKLQSPYRHFSKLTSTLHQLVRDWSHEGKAERDMCYTPILEELERVLPVTDANRNMQKVLVPGAGLGRLALEIAGKGYASQGNEFSYQMLFTSDFILNHTTEKEEFEIFPWIHNPSNAWSASDLLRGIRIPDIAPSDFFPQIQDESTAIFPPDFSFSAGDFMEAYREDTNVWDCIVTCFFIDAAPNVMEFLSTFERLLKPGGYWINLGPLLYHWQTPSFDEQGQVDERYNQSVEFTYEELKVLIPTYNFTILQEKKQECVYTHNIKSMMHTVYTCAFFTAQKNQ